jgi:hypothetical protein
VIWASISNSLLTSELVVKGREADCKGLGHGQRPADVHREEVLTHPAELQHNSLFCAQHRHGGTHTGTGGKTHAPLE